MKCEFNYFLVVSILSFSFNSVSMEGQEPAHGCDEEVIDLTCEEEIEEGEWWELTEMELETTKRGDFFDRAARNTHVHTGHSPKKPRYVAVGSPAKPHIVGTVTVKKRQMKIKVDEAATSPTKKRKVVERRAPESQIYTVITSKHTDFSTGYWVFIDPLNNDDGVAVDCSGPAWLPIIEQLASELKDVSDEEAFIAHVILFLRRNFKLIKPLVVFNAIDSGKMVCRHWATVVMPLFSKILAHGKPFSGTIQQLAADHVNKDWEMKDNGHVWNMVTLKKDGSKPTKWFVDPFNMRIANLSKTKNLTELELIAVNQDGSTENRGPVARKNMYFDFFRLTKQVFRISSRGQSLYSPREEGNLELASQKMTINYIRGIVEGTTVIYGLPTKY